MATNKTYAVIPAVPDYCERLLYVTLQGIVNRSGPRLYLVANDSIDGHWLPWYRNYGLVPDEITTDTALARYLPETNGAYVLDSPHPDWEVPLAVTLAAVDDRVIVTPQQVELLREHGVAVDPLPVPAFASRLEAMAWAVANLRPRTNPELLHANYWGRKTDNLDIVDWIVAHRGFSFRLTANPLSKPGERALLGELYNNSPLYTHVLGWHNKDDGECAHIHYASEYGMVPFCMTRNLNFSFHQHVSAKAAFRQTPLTAPRPLEKDKCYVTFVFSDGDAPHSMVDLQKGEWEKPQRGNVPFGWAVPPQMTTFGPAMLEYFYQSRTPNDELICGPSGLGYNYLSNWAAARSDVRDARQSRLEYLARTNQVMKDLDLHAMWPINRVLEWLPDGRIARRVAGNDVWVIHADNEPATYGVDFMDDGVIRDYCEQVSSSLGFFQGWHNIPNEVERVIDGRPYFPCRVLAETPEKTVAAINKCTAVDNSPSFVSVHVNCYAMGIKGVEEAIDRLNKDKYNIVLPSEFLQLRAAQQAI
ncbi:MAG: GxGYxYP domain-containing protein [Verrucomicrobiota bacterium]